MPPTEENTSTLLSVPPKSYGNFEYGFSVGRGSFDFFPGSWITIAQRVKLNDPGRSNGRFIDFGTCRSYIAIIGELQLWVDGISVMDVAGIVYRESSESRVKGFHCQTFFGGGFQSVKCLSVTLLSNRTRRRMVLA